MNDILVVNPPSLWDPTRLGADGRMSYVEFLRSTAGDDGFRTFPGEHLGLMALVAACRARGLRAAAINGQVRQDRSLEQTWRGLRAAAGPGAPAVVGFSGPCQTLPENLRLARRVRETWPGAVIVFGHDFATLNHRRLLVEEETIDAVVLGEGEATFPALCEAVLSGRSPAGIPGVATRDHSCGVSVAPPAVEPLDLDTVPLVARDDLPAVLAAGMSAGVYASRGCPYRCSYCTTGQTAGLLHRRNGHRLRNVELVADEIQMLVRDHAVGHVTIVDDLFVTRHPASQERARAFAAAIRRRGLRVPFMLDARVDSIDLATFRALRDAGLHRVFIGIETGSDEQLVAFRKSYGRSVDGPGYVARQLRLLHDLGVDVVPGVISFHPGSSGQELLDTLALIDACGYRGTFQFMNRVFVHPGTSLWHEHRRAGLLVDEWPEPSWRFADPRGVDVEAEVLDAIAAGHGYDAVREVFQRAATEWAADGSGQRVPSVGEG